MLMIVNKYTKYCAVCGSQVKTGAGFSRKEESGAWLTYCQTHRPTDQVYQPKTEKTITTPAPGVNPISQTRQLTEDGRIIITPWTYDTVTLALIKSMPGRHYDPDTKVWSVSTLPRDRAEIVKIARKLNLQIDPVWYDGKDTRAEVAKKKGLYPYQVTGIDWLNRQDKAILGDDMGLGKTVEAIMALEDKEPAIVVCPKNVLLNWKAEFYTWRPDYKVSVLNGRFGFRWPEQGEIVVLNYDILPDWLKPVNKQPVAWKFEDQAAARRTVLICDEAHGVKNSKTGKHKKVRSLAQKTKKAWFLTGTPLTNKVNDLLGLLFALGRFNDTFGTIETFVNKFNVPQGRFGYEWNVAKPDKTVPDILSKVMLRRTREQVLPDLPDITYQTLIIDELSDKLRMQLDMVQEENDQLLALNTLPPFELFSACRYQLAKARIPAMLEFVEDCEEQDVPLVVFSAHREPIDALKDRLGWAIITGDTAPTQRQAIADKFQRGELLGLGQTIQTAIGSNLSYAYTALFVDMDWTPALNSQAEHRLLRIGQKSSKINVVRMVSNHPLDLHCHQLLTDKIDLIKETVG